MSKKNSGGSRHSHKSRTPKNIPKTFQVGNVTFIQHHANIDQVLEAREKGMKAPPIRYVYPGGVVLTEFEIMESIRRSGGRWTMQKVEMG